MLLPNCQPALKKLFVVLHSAYDFLFTLRFSLDAISPVCFLVLLSNILQVNLEYLGRVVFNSDGVLYPDSLVGTDSHTTMIDGLGVAGWGVGGIEAEVAMPGQVSDLF